MSTKMKLKFNAKESVLLAMTLLLAPILLGEIYGMTLMRQQIPAFKVDPEMPQFSELPIGFAISGVIVALRYVLTKAFESIGRVVVEPKKRNQDRVERFATVLFKFLYFVFITAVGYYVMKDEDWFPTVLGGSGDVLNCYKTLYLAPSPMLKMYWMIQLGYHTHSLVYMLLLSPIRNDFLEMLVHHVATISLIGTSYVANNHAMGALVAFVHDIGDISAYGIKSMVDSGYNRIVTVLYFWLLISWAYTRLYVFPATLIYNAIFTAPAFCKDVSLVFLHSSNAMLSMLQLLHVYWYGLFLVMGYALLVKGKAEDIQQKIEDPKEPMPDRIKQE